MQSRTVNTSIRANAWELSCVVGSSRMLFSVLHGDRYCNEPYRTVLYSLPRLISWDWTYWICMILWCTKQNLYLVHDSHSPYHRKKCIRLRVRCHPCPIWPVLPISNLHFDISFASVMSKPALYRLLTFDVRIVMSILLSLGRLSKDSIQVPCPLSHFVASLFFTARS
jgi:hypothetical protein